MAKKELVIMAQSNQHDMVIDGDQLTMTHRLQFHGPLSGLWSTLIGAKIIKGFPAVMQSIVDHARREG